MTLLYQERASRIDLDAIEKLCALFQCNVGDLFEYVPDAEKSTPKNAARGDRVISGLRPIGWAKGGHNVGICAQNVFYAPKQDAVESPLKHDQQKTKSPHFFLRRPYLTRDRD